MVKFKKYKYIKYHKYQTLIINKKKLTFEDLEIFRGINSYLKIRRKLVKKSQFDSGQSMMIQGS